MAGYLHFVLAAAINFCVRHSIKLQDILECSKRLLIEAAEQQLLKSGKPVTVSKLSLMTGVHRKDIMRLRGDQSDKSKRSGDLITRIVGQWQNDKRFATKNGRGRTLSFENGKGEFADLVTSVSKEIKPYAILTELERIGMVERTSRGIKLRSRFYNPKGNPAKAFMFLEEDSQDLVKAVEENIFGEHDFTNLHIKTEYNNVPASKLEEIRKWFLIEGSAFHQRARNYLSQFDRDINRNIRDRSEAVRVAVASFSIVDESSPAPKEENSNDDQ